MEYAQGQRVKITRGTLSAAPGAVCVVHRSEGFGCYILRGPIGSSETEGNLFAALKGDFEAEAKEAGS